MLEGAFFARIRENPFGGHIVQSQVNGMSELESSWDKYGDGTPAKFAYVLGTVFHETARTMQPIEEFGRGRGKKYGVVDESGQAPFGRGFVQLTWRKNYLRADAELGLDGALASDYSLALRPDIAGAIAVRGMLEGWFTGKKLGEYIKPASNDFVNARKVINGLDCAEAIAVYATNFLQALSQ